MILCSDEGKKEGKWEYGPKESPHCKAVLLCFERIAIDFSRGCDDAVYPMPILFQIHDFKSN